MPGTGDKTRLHVVLDALKGILSEMTQRSFKQGTISARYRVGIIAYSDDEYDLLKGIRTIKEIYESKLVPQTLDPINRTNTLKALTAAKKLVQEDVARWTTVEREKRPAPIVIHLTDGEYTESTGDPRAVAQEIQQIVVPDGNVLLENIFIRDNLKVGSLDVTAWPGYMKDEDTGDPYGNQLLSMSSPLPASYKTYLSEEGYQLAAGSRMMYPGIRPEFVKLGFCASRGSDTVGGGQPGVKSSREDN
jgi:hypothetical protein